MEKERLDIILTKKGYFETREKARSAIMAGSVYVNNIKEDKPGSKFAEDVAIEVRDNVNPFVSRGGLKLEKAINTFGIVLDGKTAMDIGASTGGFTDCMLKRGAVKVFAVDVGYGQLAWSLRQDERVVCMERTNIRYVKPEDIGVLCDFASIDVSFISLKKVLPVAAVLTSPSAEIAALIKPQFEAGRDKVGKHGVVRDPQVHMDVIKEIVMFASQINLTVKGLTYSPIKGPEGNIEYLLYLSKSADQAESVDFEQTINGIVAEAHGSL